MAWPELSQVRCSGFPPTYLRAIVTAIESGVVQWGTTVGGGESRYDRFSFAGSLWEMSEVFELVDQITLIERSPTLDDLLVAILRGKIDK